MTSVAIVLGCLALILLLVRTWWAKVHKRFARVDEGVWRAAAMSEQRLTQVVRRHGIRTVIDFRRNLDLVEAERAILLPLGVTHLHLRSPQRPDEPAVQRFLEVMPGVQRPVLLHCTLGTGRTPFFAALYLIRFRGWAVQRAVRRAYWPSMRGHHKFTRIRAARAVVQPDAPNGDGSWPGNGPGPTPASGPGTSASTARHGG